jgi:hypothetical protein
MTTEKTPSPARLTRREKLRNRVLIPTTVVLGGVATVMAMNGSAEKTSAPESPEQVTVHVDFNGEFEEGVALQETVMNSIKMAVENAAYKGFSELGVSEDTDVIKIVNEVPVYDAANEALEMGDNGELPDPGDPFTGEGNVTVDKDKNVSFEVTDAEIIDIPNNQQ